MSIDYGFLPGESGMLPNRDPETGIRYGIVSIGELNEYALDAFEPVYVCGCPECGNEFDGNDLPESCPSCGYTPDDESEWYGDESIGCEYNGDGYSLWLDEYNDVWVFKSPHTTSKWSNCSPCARGAADLEGDEDHGDDLAYCLGPDWYENE